MLYTLPLFDFIVSVRRFFPWMVLNTYFDVHHYNRCRLRNSWIRFFFSSLMCCTVAATVCRHHKSWMKFLFAVWRISIECVVCMLKLECISKRMNVFVFSTNRTRYMAAAWVNGRKLEKARNTIYGCVTKTIDLTKTA